jgi:CelD/BcsL family acetyltransferase involved in cellulose biosynthesis
VADGRVYALRSDFDAEFEEISPGTHLNRSLLQQLFGRGLQRYYMGPGENAYKHRWTEQVEPVEAVTVYGRSLAGRSLAAWETSLKPFARKLRARIARMSSPKPKPDDD